MNTEKNKSNFQFQEPRLVESIFIENPNYKGKFQEIHPIMYTLSVLFTLYFAFGAA